MKCGDTVRIVSIKEIDDVARMFTHGSGPCLSIGDLGVVGLIADDGLFEVRFGQCTIVCNNAMVEVIP